MEVPSPYSHAARSHLFWPGNQSGLTSTGPGGTTTCSAQIIACPGERMLQSAQFKALGLWGQRLKRWESQLRTPRNLLKASQQALGIVRALAMQNRLPTAVSSIPWHWCEVPVFTPSTFPNNVSGCFGDSRSLQANWLPSLRFHAHLDFEALPWIQQLYIFYSLPLWRGASLQTDASASG